MNSAIQATRDRTATEKGPQHAINTRKRCCAGKVANKEFRTVLKQGKSC